MTFANIKHVLSHDEKIKLLQEADHQVAQLCITAYGANSICYVMPCGIHCQCDGTAYC